MQFLLNFSVISVYAVSEDNLNNNLKALNVSFVETPPPFNEIVAAAKSWI